MKSVENSYALASSVGDLNCRGIHLRWSFSLSLFDQRGSSAESRMSCFWGTLSAPVNASWLRNVKRICGKTRLVITARVHDLRDEYTRTIDPALALAAETLKLERTLSDLVTQAYALTPAEIA